MPWKPANVEATIESRGDVRTGPPFLKLEPGKEGKARKTYLRVLPPRDDLPEEYNDKMFIWVRVHMGVGANNRSVKCVQDETYCVVCEAVGRLRDAGKDEAAQSTAAKFRALMNVCVVDEDSKVIEDTTVKVWACPKDLALKLLEAIEELPKKARDISHPETGRDIWVKRRGSTMKKTEYEVGVTETASKFNGGDFGLLEDGLHDLPAVYPTLEPERVQKLLAAPTRSESWEEDDGAKPAAVEGSFREVPAATPKRRREDPDDEKTDTKPEKKSKRPADEDEQNAARERLRRIAEQAEGDDDDPDAEGDED